MEGTAGKVLRTFSDVQKLGALIQYRGKHIENHCISRMLEGDRKIRLHQITGLLICLFTHIEALADRDRLVSDVEFLVIRVKDVIRIPAGQILPCFKHLFSVFIDILAADLREFSCGRLIDKRAGR